MSDSVATDFRLPRRHVRLDTILRLRWLAALGQLAAIFIVEQGLEFDVEVMPCLTIVGFSALLNFIIQLWFDPLQRLPPPFSGGLVGLDIRRLAGAVFFSRGV